MLPVVGLIVAPSPGSGSKSKVPPGVLTEGLVGFPGQKLDIVKVASAAASTVIGTISLSGQAPAVVYCTLYTVPGSPGGEILTTVPFVGLISPPGEADEKPKVPPGVLTEIGA